jgi:hypothetical protein
MKFFPEFQKNYAELKVRLEKLKLPGVDKAESIQEGIAEILKGDASDATFSLGKPDAKLFLELQWAKKVKSSIDNGIESVIEKIKNTQNEVELLPGEGLTGQLKDSVKIKFEDIDRILQSDNFFEQAVSLYDFATEIESEVMSTCENFKEEQNENIRHSIEEVKQTYEWGQLNDEQKQEFSSRLDNALIKDKSGIKGIREIITEVYSFNNSLKTIRTEINEAIRFVPAVAGVDPAGGIPQTKKTKPISLSHISKRIQSKEDVDKIIETFTKLKDNWNDDEVIDIKW